MPFRCIPPYILLLLDARRPFEVKVDDMHVCWTPTFAESTTNYFLLKFDGEKLEVAESGNRRESARIDDNVVNLAIDLIGAKIRAPLWIELEDGTAYCFGNGKTLECHILPVKLDKTETGETKELTIEDIVVVFLGEKSDNKTAYFAVRTITWTTSDDMVKLEGATLIMKPETFRRLIEVTDNGKKLKLAFEAQNIDGKRLGTLTELLEALAFLKL